MLASGSPREMLLTGRDITLTKTCSCQYARSTARVPLGHVDVLTCVLNCVPKYWEPSQKVAQNWKGAGIKAARIPDRNSAVSWKLRSAGQAFEDQAHKKLR